MQGKELGEILNRKWITKAIVLLLVCCIVIPNTLVYAADRKYVRVGLKSLYSERLSIQIKNKELSMGYCVNSTYVADETFTSSNGFTFIPEKGYFYSMNKTYSNYKGVCEIAKSLKKFGVNAYPVATAQKKYRIYVGGGTAEEAQMQYNKVKGKYGFTYVLKKPNSYRVKVLTSSIPFLIDIEAYKGYPQFQPAESDMAGVRAIDLGNRKYRGRIEIGRYGKDSLTAVNVLYIEDYLKGVVPCEMVSTWNLEALKAQAVCARGYAILNSGYQSESNLSKPFAICDTTSSQMYKGYGAETDRTNQAVNLTRNQTVRYQNKIISTYYSSTSGGRTESAEDVWSSAEPYLRSEPDLYENEPEKPPWLSYLTKEQIESKLSTAGIHIGSIKNIYPEIKTGSGRVYSLKIEGKKDTVTLQSGTIRTRLGLYSTKFKLITQGDVPDRVVIRGANQSLEKQISSAYVISGNNKVEKASTNLEQYIVISSSNRTNFPKAAPKNQDTYLFAGQGYGHGVGMSQSGANGMAKAGYNYVQILKHYYKGTKVVQSK